MHEWPEPSANVKTRQQKEGARDCEQERTDARGRSGDDAQSQDR